MSDNLLYDIWISRIFRYGNQKVWMLLDQFGSAQAVYEAGETALSACSFLRKEDCAMVQKTSIKRAELIVADCAKHDIKILSYTSPDYPERLRNIYAAPPVLYLKGDLSGIDNEVVISVVGTRKASPYGCRLTGNLCYEMSRAGAVIVSGCAEGVDTYAHWGTLKAGGRTIAVLGCGLDINYPSKNKQLKEAILKKKGALLSECPPGERVTRFIFPIRNRLIAALSVGVLLTEAPIKSGALITAEHAIEQGKELFCVPPHDIYDANFGGVSNYLRDGAKAVLASRDVLEEYQYRYPDKLNLEILQSPLQAKTTPLASTRSVTETGAGAGGAGGKNPQPQKEKELEQVVPPPPEPIPWDPSLGSDYLRVYEAMSGNPIHLDEIAAKVDLPIYTATAIITELELRGYITSHSGKRYAQTAPQR